ncbi:MAG TPA: gamma-glutamyl-gamma-aminobutyrate hydrolase family protein [Dehalococcoidia bacterium]|nr:gamma-glutamyl-gamma-aminobutyrate hydrolase family protein [Dehalococcoidia bacterium]
MPAPIRIAVPRWLAPDGAPPSFSQQNYLNRISELGFEAVDFTEIDGSLPGCAGLVLTGGVDVDPALYGEAPHPETDEVNRPRDDFELALLREALESDIPVLAICRGHQLLNVCLGGSLLQHIEGDGHRWQEDVPVTSRFHDVRFADGSKLARIYGQQRVQVNSRHHQGVTRDRLAAGLICTAITDDGFVEGIESADHRWVVGVQWHPERPEPETGGFAETSALLWQAFAAEVKGR